MRWLIIVLLVSVVALLIASGGVAHHIWREHIEGKRKRMAAGAAAAKGEETDVETEDAP